MSISFNKTILPLAISFYTFTQISFIVDAYRGEIKECKLIDYLLYVTYFPKMIQGPIMYFSEMAPQFNDVNRKMINWENMVEGFERFVFGLSKKVLLADVLARAVGSGFLNIESLDLINGLIVMLSYTLQIYLDFSGYSDMAIGISKMFNIDLIENFNNPYKAINISDFWKRWHISLTRFLTKYIYIPLGGNRKGETRTYINTIIVFLISGLWHGANWTFILWGLTNGIAMVIYKKYSKYFNRIPKFISWLIAFVFISFAWIIFRASSINEFILFIEKIFNFKSLKLNQELIDSFAFTSFDFVPETLQFIRMFKTSRFYVLIYLFIGMYAALKQYSINGGRNSKLVRVLIILLFVYSVISFTGTNAFVYEGF